MQPFTPISPAFSSLPSQPPQPPPRRSLGLGQPPGSWGRKTEMQTDKHCSRGAAAFPHMALPRGAEHAGSACVPRMCCQDAAPGERKQHPRSTCSSLPNPHHAYLYPSTMHPTVITTKHTAHAMTDNREPACLYFFRGPREKTYLPSIHSL